MEEYNQSNTKLYLGNIKADLFPLIQYPTTAWGMLTIYTVALTKSTI